MTKKYRVSKKRQAAYRLTYTFYDFYETYDRKDKIARDIYISISKDFFDLLTTDIVVKRKRYILPINLGHLRIRKILTTKDTKPRIDYYNSKRLGKIVYFLNLHTNGNVFEWYWYKPRRLKNRNLYYLQITRDINKKLATEIFRCARDPYLKDYNALS